MTTKKPKKYESHLTSDEPNDLVQSMLITIYGPPGTGKTWTALAASSFWPESPEQRTKKDKEIVLEDVVHISWDNSASIGLNPHAIRVGHRYDMNQIIADYDHNLSRATREVSKDVRNLVHNNDEIKLVIHDTITAADMQSVAWHFGESRVPLDRGGKPVTKQAWGAHLAWHSAYFVELTQLPTGVASVFLFHEYVMETPDEPTGPTSKKQKAVAQTRQLGDFGVNVVPRISGSARTIYEGQVSLEMPLFSTAVKGKKGLYNRTLYTIPHAGRRAKNRFPHLLDEKEPAHLGKILDKIKNGK